ncbi:MAG TPA: RNA-binding protein [Candidatus Pacearchaeota archaeon]|nr:RNA-binding protein [Candidatus Pacearchaeota archaeon]
MDKIERKIVIPGEVIAKGNGYLPGEGTEKNGEEIVSIKYGLAEESNRLIKVISLSGVYQPRRGNVIIGKVENITFHGWVVDIGSADRAFLSVQEVPRYVNKDGLHEVLDVGDMMVSKIVGISGRGIDLTIKSRGFGRIDEGMIVKVNPNKVPRIIGKEGSMINLIKDESGCNITVGQNGFIWVQGSKVEDELLVRKAIAFIERKSFASGLTEEVKRWFEKEKGGKGK